MVQISAYAWLLGSELKFLKHYFCHRKTGSQSVVNNLHIGVISVTIFLGYFLLICPYREMW